MAQWCGHLVLKGCRCPTDNAACCDPSAPCFVATGSMQIYAGALKAFLYHDVGLRVWKM